MTIIEEYLDYAELAQAAYITNLITDMYNNSYVNNGDNVLLSEFSDEQARIFSERYEVRAVADSFITGLDAVLFYDTTNNKYVLSIRGTTSYADVLSDIMLATTGVAYGQLMALNDFYSEWVLDGTIPIGAKLDVTGHSLGGSLAQIFAASHPNEVSSVYSYNAPGIGGLTTDAYNILGIESQDGLFSNITNIYAKEGPKATAGLGTMLGSVEAISIDEDSTLGNHRMGHLTESLHVYNMLSKIANTQNLDLLTSIMEDVTNEKVIQVIEVAFSDQQSGSIIDQAIALTDNNKGKATGLINLTHKTPTGLNNKSLPNLYALLNSNPFAIEGNLPAYADINPNDYSDMYMSDRADYMFYILDKDARYGDGTGKDSYRAFDSYGTSLSGKTGNQVIFGTDNYNNSYQLKGGSGDDRIYGLGGDDELVGGAGYDYMEGGVGDDTISGGADNDTLQGNTGNDILYGDTGDDTLLGGTDNDVLFGGSGSDTLLGQSGDDVLAGSDAENLYGEKTHDYLLGGTGFDTYYVSDQDVINDVDGSGLVMFNDKSLSGVKTKIPDSEMYEDDYFTYEDSNGYLIVREKSTNEVVVIENYSNGMLGISFDDGSNTQKTVELFVGDVTVTEGGELEFMVAITETLKYDLTVNVGSYFNGSADANDLISAYSGTVTILAGELNKSFTPAIDTKTDDGVEGTETFIFAATGYTYAGEGEDDNDLGSLLIKNAGEGTILDGDEEPTPEPLTIQVSSASKDEANTTMSFTVSLTGTLEAGETLTVNFATSDGSANAGYDYASTSQSVTFTQTNMTQTIEVPIYDDPYKEPDETFYLHPISSSGYTGDKEVIFSNAGTGTILDNDQETGQVVIEVSSTSADEGDSGTQSAAVTVSISSALSDDLYVNMSDGNSYTIAAGSTSTTARVFWGSGVVDVIEDSDNPVGLSVVDFDYFGSEENIFVGHGGQVDIVDDDSDGHKPPYDPGKGGMNDPLILDTDKDGFISTISLQDSNAYFDLTGDGTKEKVGWIKPNDGILVYDKNNNGNIDGIDEVFGNATTSGFSELKQIADSNNDNKIDRRDELYNRLQVWHDNNGNGTVEQGELKSLKDEGVKSINLNYVKTDIELGSANIINNLKEVA